MNTTDSETWLSLSDLSRLYGVSSIHCSKTLREHGWRAMNGTPTKKALEDGAASPKRGISHSHTTKTTLWNTKICKNLFHKTTKEGSNRSVQVNQWATLLQELEAGCPSINESASQMAEDLPRDLIEEVNIQLASRGCGFRVIEKNNCPKK